MGNTDISVSYRHRSPRVKSFFSGSSKKSCRFLVIDNNARSPYGVAYPTKENLTKTLNGLNDDSHIHVTVPSFKSIMRYLLGDNFILSTPLSMSRNIDNDVSYNSGFKICLQVPKKKNIPAVISRNMRCIDGTENILYTEILDSKLLTNHNLVTLFNGEYLEETHSITNIRKNMSIIKMIYASEDRKMVLYHTNDPETSERQRICELLKFMKNYILVVQNGL